MAASQGRINLLVHNLVTAGLPEGDVTCVKAADGSVLAWTLEWPDRLVRVTAGDMDDGKVLYGIYDLRESQARVATARTWTGLARLLRPLLAE